MDPNDLVKQVNMKLKRLNDCGFTTWYCNAWELIHRFDINVEIDRHAFEDYFKKKLKDYFIQNWMQTPNDIIENQY